MRDTNELRKLAESKNLVLKIGRIYRSNNAINNVAYLLEGGYLGLASYRTR